MSDEVSQLATVLAEAFWKCMDDNRGSLDGDFHDSSIGLIDGALPPGIFGTLAEVAERHYRPPIEAAEQLNQLPGYSVVITSDETVWQNAPHARDTWWQPADGCGILGSEMPLPVRLIWTGGQA